MGWRTKTTQPLQNIQCSFVQKPVIHLMPLVQAKIPALMNSYPHTEWCGYLVGQPVADGYVIDDLVIPPHEASEGGYCLAEPFHEPKGCIGFLHSHHGMGAFHSGQDAMTVDKNYPISLVVANRQGLDYAPLVNMETPCHQKFQTTAIISLITATLPLPHGWLETAITNINKPHTVKVLLLPVSIARQLPSTTVYLKPYTVDNQGNLRDKLGHYAGKNKSILNPIDKLIYYMDEQGNYFTQKEFDYLKKGIGAHYVGQYLD